MPIIHYLNLTNGIEALPQIPNPHFIRIQSTACEQKRWDFVLQDLDNDFLMNLAIGNECVVYDFGCKGESRALWQGVEFIRYVLTRRWHNKKIECFYRGNKLSIYFDEIYCKLENRTFKKLDYFKKFLAGDEIRIKTVSGRTEHDSNYAWYREAFEKEIIR